MRGVITSGKLIVMGIVVFGLSEIGWAQTYSDEPTATTEAGQIQALAQAFQVSPQTVEALRAKHAALGGQAWDAVASHLTQAQPAAYTEPVAFPRHAVQIRGLAQAFQVSPQVVQALWAKHAAVGGQAWDAVAMELAEAQASRQTNQMVASTNY